MKLLVKLGLGTVLPAALLLSASAAVNPLAQADFIAIQQAQARARVENDRIKLNCINDKLVLAKAVYNLIDSGDNSKVPELHELRVAADACVGKRNMYSDAGNSFTGPSGVVQPSGTPTDWGVTFEPPVNASPSVPSTGRFTRGYGRSSRYRLR